MADRLNDSIRALMFERKLNMKELAEKMGLTPPYVSMLLSGKRRWNKEQIVKAAKALNVAVATLFSEAKDDVTIPNAVCAVFSDKQIAQMQRICEIENRSLENLVLHVVSLWLRSKGAP